MTELGKVVVGVGMGKFTGPGIGGMTLIFPRQMANKVRALDILNGIGAIREVGVAAHNLTSLTLVSAGDYSAYVSFTASGGTAGSHVHLAPGVDPILADCTLPPMIEGWWRGNTHTHTHHSDGDATTDAAVNWYARHGYSFVAVTDHDKVTAASSGDILVLNGTEVTAQNHPALHMAVINTPHNIAKGSGNETQAILDVLAATPASAIAILAHPGWYGPSLSAMVTPADLQFIEIYSGIPSIGSSESIWDDVLMARFAAGNYAPLYGVAADDTHIFASNPPAGSATPGRGWVMVRASAPQPTAAAVVAAMKAGDFYSSSGVIFETLTRTADSLSIEVLPEPNLTYSVRLVVARSTGITTTVINDIEASYTLQPGDRYARMVAEASNGEMAWTQPVMAS